MSGQSTEPAMDGNQRAGPRWGRLVADCPIDCQTVADSLSVPARTLSKHELQYTGRSLRGANGTIAWPPQLQQIAAWNSRGPPAVRACFAAARHAGQRWGSFSRPLLEKNACSPLEKTNSSEQSRQVSVRSSYTLSGASSGVVALDKPPVVSGERRNRTAFSMEGRTRDGCDRAPIRDSVGQNTGPVKHSTAH